MEYNLTDLLKVLKDVELKFAILYSNISIMDGNTNMQFKTAAKILSGEEKKHEEDYATLILQIEKDNEIKISRDLYTKAFITLNKFQLGIVKVNLSNTNELIEFAVKYEKKNAELLNDILMQMENVSMDLRAIELFQRLIKIEERHADMLSIFLKKN